MIENPARIASKLRNFSARPDSARPAPGTGPARLTPLLDTPSQFSVALWVKYGILTPLE